MAPQNGHYDVPHVMDHAETGWASPSQRWSWTDIARLEKWRLGRPHRDEHSDGFWLHATHATDSFYGQGKSLLQP
ncbi:hypothetical protein [Nonomuraea sp. NPDC049695]|uniref:hypothetical protein n=1 Tax=Nonomuraea sp. NPDC049695 TaxID=3154734 RepID=UPI00341BC20B